MGHQCGTSLGMCPLQQWCSRRKRRCIKALWKRDGLPTSTARLGLLKRRSRPVTDWVFPRPTVSLPNKHLPPPACLHPLTSKCNTVPSRSSLTGRPSAKHMHPIASDTPRGAPYLGRRGARAGNASRHLRPHRIMRTRRHRGPCPAGRRCGHLRAVLYSYQLAET